MKENGDIEKRIIAALTEVNVISEPKEWEVIPAAGGLSNRVYLIQRAGQTSTFTVRLPTPGQSGTLSRQHALFVELNTGCACIPSWSLLLEAGDLPEGMLFVHRFISGSPAELNVVSSAARAALAACLACLHSQSRQHYTIWPGLRPASGSRARLFHDRLEAMKGHATFVNGLGPERQTRIEALYVRLSSATLPDDAGWNETGFAQLHGDLTLGNMVWNGDSVTLIDWEYARDGDPAEDLAYLFSEQPVSEGLITDFHHSYIMAGGDPNTTKRAAWYSPLVALDSALWWGDYHLRQGNDPSSAQEVLGFIELAEAGLRYVEGE